MISGTSAFVGNTFSRGAVHSSTSSSRVSFSPFTTISALSVVVPNV